MLSVLFVDDNSEKLHIFREYYASHFQISISDIKGCQELIKNLKSTVCVFSTEAALSESYPTPIFPQIKKLIILQSLTDIKMDLVMKKGFQDWLIEPIRFDQLLWRIKFLGSEHCNASNSILTLGHAKLLPQTHEIEESGLRYSLTPIQMRLLITFSSFPDKLLTRDWLRFKVWNGEPISQRSIDAHISKLKKLIPSLLEPLESVYGRGYVWNTKKINYKDKIS